MQVLWSELAAELKEAEKNGQQIDAEMEQPGTPTNIELTEVKHQLSEFMTYAAMMEKRQMQLTEQLSAVCGAMQATGILGLRPGSPQQPILPRENGMSLAATGVIEVSAEDNERTRSEKRERPSEKEDQYAEWLQQDIGSDEVALQLGQLSDACQTAILSQIDKAPLQYKSREQFGHLVQTIQKEESNQAEANQKGMELPNVLPFRKMGRERRRDANTPYQTPPASRRSTAGVSPNAGKLNGLDS